MASIWAGFSIGGGGGGGGGGPNPNIQIPGLQQTVDQLTQLNTAVSGLTTALGNLAGQQQQMSQNINRMFSQIGTNAGNAANQVNNMNQAVQSTVQSTSGGGVLSKLFGVASAAAGSDILKDLAMFPLRFITQTVEANRQLSMNLQAQLSGQMFATQGRLASGPTGITGMLSRFPGNVQGSPEDLINLMTVARASGAMMEPGAPGAATQGSARTVGFLKAISQMQMMTPATPVGTMASAVGQQLQPQAQQQAAFLTGGAFAMLGAGGRVKSLQEWAEGILRWIEGLRPPPDTGKPFDYGQLLAQYFPGSNIDAWLSMNGITPDMKEYWWNYSLGKASKTSSTQGAFTIGPIGTSHVGAEGNQPWERLQAVSARGRGELQLAQQMGGMYTNKEQANRWWADLMGQIQRDVIPKQVSRGALSSLQFLPDTLQELLMGFLERSGSLGALIGGGIGYGIHGAQSLTKNLIGFGTEGLVPSVISESDMAGFMDIFSGGFRGGGGVIDALSQLAGIGDEPGIGDSSMEWGMHGTTSTAGLHPDMRRKVNRMMKANPKIKVVSGLRDTATQENLKNRGYSRVSGKPSAHTRGLAADLGPSSQYGWIMKNAKRFGLNSGKSFGEPWHVGIGDPPVAPPDTNNPATSYVDPDNDVTWSWYPNVGEHGAWLANNPPAGYPGSVYINAGAPPTVNASTAGQVSIPAASEASSWDLSQLEGGGGAQGIGRLFSLFSGGFDRDTQIDAIGKLVPSIMTLFLGAFGMSDEGDPSALRYDPDLYNQLVRAGGGTGGNTLQFGGVQSRTAASGYSYAKSMAFSKSGVMGTQGGTNATATGATSLQGALEALGVKAAGMSPGVMVAHIAHAAGFPNSAIASVVGLSKRESGWRPDAFNGDTTGTKDLSYGLMQINMLGNLGPARRQEYGLSTNEELFDPLVNLKAAYKLSGGGTNFFHWGGYKGEDNFYNTNMDEARQITREAGFGDAPESYTQIMPLLDGGASSGPGGMVFHNQFIINATGGPPSSGGFDVRRVVSQMADQLEGEMKKRTVRSN